MAKNKKLLDEKALKKLCSERCEQCYEEDDKEFCHGCQLSDITKNPKSSIISYCKECRGGESIEVCASKQCPFYDIMPEILAEVAAKIQKKA